MKAWISAFGKAKRSLIELKSSSTIAESSDPESPRPTSMPLGMSVKSQSTSVLDKTSDTSKRNGGPSLLQNNNHSMVMLSTLPDDSSVTLASSTSLTPHLVCEAAKAQVPHQPAQSQPPMSPTTSQSISATMTAPASPTPTAQAAPNGQSSWGFPWMLVPNMLSSSTTEDADHPPPSPMSPTVNVAPLPTVDSDGHPVVWPARQDDAHIPKSDLAGYTSELEMRNRELRHLFGGVSNDEMVLDAFICSLKKKPAQTFSSEEPDDQSDSQPSLSPTTPTVNTFANLDQDLSEHLAGPIQSPASDFGYSYTGRAFVTQETFWFYSCVLMTCVNTVSKRKT